MRRSKHTLLRAFGVGMFWAGAGTAGAFGLHVYLAPPAETNASDHIKTAIAELVPGLARWASLPFAPATPAANQPATVVTTVVDDGKPSQRDEATLRDAQTRVAKHQADVQAERILVRSIQQELSRVGCYAGAIDGQWSDGTRNAMGAFTEQLKVRLPLSSPDYILLTMLQGHSRQACGPANANDKSVVAAVDPKRSSAARQGPARQAGLDAGTPGQAEGPAPAQGEAAHALPKQQFRTVVTPAPQPSVKPQDGKQLARRPAEVRVTSTQQPAAAAVPQYVAPYVASSTFVPASQLPGRMAIGAPPTPQDASALRAAPAVPAPDAVAVKPPVPAARAPQPAPQPSRSAPRPEPVRAAASSQRQNSGGGEGGGGGGSRNRSSGGGDNGGGGSRSQVFSRLGSNAP